MNSLSQMYEISDTSSIATEALESERHYRDSIYSLEQKLTLDPKCIESIRLWISSYHQLSVIYQNRGEWIAAQKCLLIPHHSMLYMANHTDDEEVELIAIRAINITLPKLMEFAKVHPPCRSCMTELREQMKMLESNNKSLH